MMPANPRPVAFVTGAARRIGAGELSHRVPIMAYDEIGDVAQQFNEMAAALERVCLDVGNDQVALE